MAALQCLVFTLLVRYWQLDVSKVPAANVRETWDRSVFEASEEYKGRIVSETAFISVDLDHCYSCSSNVSISLCVYVSLQCLHH